MKYTIGVDFGTQSGRAVLVEVGTGRVLSQHAVAYAHGVMTERLPSGVPLPENYALAHPADYLEVLSQTVREVVRASAVNPSDVIGIGVDATSCSLVATDQSFTPLCMLPEWEDNPEAYIKMWKHHAAREDADKLNQLAKQRGEPFLPRCGGTVSCEWSIPKIMETLRKNPEVYEAAAYFFDLCDWLTSILAGYVCRSCGSAGYKTLWNPALGYPSDAFFTALAPRFQNSIHSKLAGEISPLGSRAGTLCERMAEALGLPSGIAVASGALDGHTPLIALGLLHPGEMLLVIGTSTVAAVLSDQYREIEGICGVLRDGMAPGLYGYDSGQSCVGDMFDWFIRNCVPAEYHTEAKKRRISLHGLLTEKSGQRKPAGLISLDWWNGNRSLLADMDLTGAMFGLTLNTKPEDMYRALLESTAFGIKRIIQGFKEQGIAINQVYASGGIPLKSEFLMQIYADVLDREIRVSTLLNAAAVGSAISAASSAGKSDGGYDSLPDAVSKMADKEAVLYSPEAKAAESYRPIYKKYTLLYELFGKQFTTLLKRMEK